MQLFFALSAGIFYTLLISFADATASRILIAFYQPSRKRIKHKWQFILSGRSKCDFCNEKLSPKALIPVLGYSLLRGQCEFCQTKLPKRYFYQEAAAFFFGLVLGFFHPDITYICATGIYLIALVIAMRIDWAYLLIPTEIILFLLVFSLGEMLWRLGHIPLPTAEILEADYSIHLLIAFVWYALFYLIRILSRYQMGLADVRLVLILSIGLGYPISIYFPTVAAGLGILFYLLNRYLFRQKTIIEDKGLKTKLAFGVFLGIAFLLLRVL